MMQSCPDQTLNKLFRKISPLYQEIDIIYSATIQRLKQERINSLLRSSEEHLDKLDQKQKKIIHKLKLKNVATGNHHEKQIKQISNISTYRTQILIQQKVETDSYQNISNSIENLTKAIHQQLQISKTKDNPLKIKYQQQYLKQKLNHFKPKKLKIGDIQYNDFPSDIDYSKINYLRLTSIDHNLATLLRKYFKNLKQLKLDESLANFNALNGHMSGVLAINSPFDGSTQFDTFRQLSKISSLDNLVISLNTRFATAQEFKQYYSWFPKNKILNLNHSNFDKFRLIQFILDNSNWEEIIFPGMNAGSYFQLDSQLFDFVHKLIPNLKGIDISSGVINLQTLKSIGKFHQLKKLKICTTSQESQNLVVHHYGGVVNIGIDLSSGIKGLISNLHNLTTLDISQIQLSCNNLQNIYNSCPQLQNFRFISNINNKFDSFKLIKILIKFQKLKKLWMKIKKLTSEEWLQLSNGKFKLNSFTLYQQQQPLQIQHRDPDPIVGGNPYNPPIAYYNPPIIQQPIIDPIVVGNYYNPPIIEQPIIEPIQGYINNKVIKNQVQKQSSLFFKNQTTLKQFKMKSMGNDYLCMSISQLKHLQTLYLPFLKMNNQDLQMYRNYGMYSMEICCFSNNGFTYLSKLRCIKSFNANISYKNTYFYISSSLNRFIRNNKEIKIQNQILIQCLNHKHSRNLYVVGKSKVLDNQNLRRSIGIVQPVYRPF